MARLCAICLEIRMRLAKMPPWKRKIFLDDLQIAARNRLKVLEVA